MSAVASERTVVATSGTEDRPLGTVPQVAEFLSLSRSKVYDLMDSGTLQYVKLGKSRRVRWSDVMRLVEKSVVGA